MILLLPSLSSANSVTRPRERTPSAAQPTINVSYQPTPSSSSGTSPPPPRHHAPLPGTNDGHRKAGQGGDADREVRDLRAELLAAEAAHQAKLNGGAAPQHDRASSSTPEPTSHGTKRALEAGPTAGDAEDEDPEAKRRRVLEETRDIDADDSDEEEDDDDSEDDDSDDDSDDDAELQRELERVKRERMEKREREEREKAAVEEEARERDIARGNPLLNKTDFNIKRRYVRALWRVDQWYERTGLTLLFSQVGRRCGLQEPGERHRGQGEEQGVHQRSPSF